GEFGDQRFAGTGRCGDQHRTVFGEMCDGLYLKIIEGKRITRCKGLNFLLRFRPNYRLLFHNLFHFISLISTICTSLIVSFTMDMNKQCREWYQGRLTWSVRSSYNLVDMM